MQADALVLLAEARRLAALAEVEAIIARSQPKPRRNQPCPCGSGAKYKHFCLRLREGTPHDYPPTPIVPAEQAPRRALPLRSGSIGTGSYPMSRRWTRAILWPARRPARSSDPAPLSPSTAYFSFFAISRNSL